MPKSIKEVWIWFKRLSNRRQQGMGGVNPILYSEMKAFFDMQGFYPTPEEILIMETFDSITVAHYAKKKPTKPKGK